MSEKKAITVLVAEDEPMVRELVVEGLRMLGYDVIEAANGPDALRAAQDAPRIDLLVADMVMPGMTGAELADRLSARVPGLKVLLMSGYADPGLLADALRVPGRLFLRKPFQLGALGAWVQKALALPLA